VTATEEKKGADLGLYAEFLKARKNDIFRPTWSESNANTITDIGSLSAYYQLLP
jgi:hypothetical protein